ncbi:hypothetical protein L2E82_03901 [Cichorium intybus]|uniref:Uncharacterized protein n=1 Tax=Cichorium intybus TaxID=13427 RepID=A0ACB9H6T6_CICIN|nr:hypothetical protein L2E82_03901 [Cichorium intybus]
MDLNTEITLIKDLDITKSIFNLKVKVLRLWTHPDLRNIGEIFSIEMILMDEESLLLNHFGILTDFTLIIEADVSNGASLFAAIHIFIFKKAMSLYTKERARNEVITGEDGDVGVEDSRVEDSSGDGDAGVKDSGNISNGGSRRFQSSGFQW